MSGCTKCVNGYWRGRAGYPCYSCNSGRARRKAAGVSTGRMLQIDAMPTLSEVKAHAATCPDGVVARMGPGAQRMRAARMWTGTAWAPAPAATPVVAAQAAATRADAPLRPYTAGRPRSYAELFPEDATDADRAEFVRI